MKYYDQLNAQQQEAIDRHLSLVMKINETTNLTRIDDEEEARILHIEDSLSGMKEFEESPDGLYGDLGSGAGYPGIPLAIVSGRETILVDSRQKKMKLMDGVIAELGLENQVSTFAGRAELLAQSKGNSFAVLTARALAKLPVLLELASPLLIKRGHLICYKAKVEEEELKHAESILDMTGMRLVGIREFMLEDTFTRSIITFEKVKKPTVKLPRREGEAQKSPLVAS